MEEELLDLLNNDSLSDECEELTEYLNSCEPRFRQISRDSSNNQVLRINQNKLGISCAKLS